MDSVLREDSNGVARVTLNRPHRMNALGNDTFEQLPKILDDVMSDPSVYAVVFTGAGKVFSSGADIDDIEYRATGAEFRWFQRQRHDLFDHIEAMEKPTIAAINGVCVGGGIELAICCDFRIAAESATFSYPENRLGLMPGSGGLSRMAKLIGVPWTKEMVLTERTLSSSEARAISLVTRVAPDDQLLEEAQKLGELFTTKARHATGVAKSVIDTCLNVDVSTGRVIERLGQSLLVGSDEYTEGLASFREKRRPNFSGKVS